MEAGLFQKYAPLIMEMNESELAREIDTPKRLLIGATPINGKTLSIAYAPFDHVNPAARVVIVGLTPGRQQMRNALMEVISPH